ncbi:GntR family transcriptional regulator [Halomonas sp. C05BenzN]|uniref:GntR family transcriptional regulator n=1 Tax=Halomonas sp. C05BenzN TaxID=3411041 RepID=UPI003B95AD65
MANTLANQLYSTLKKGIDSRQLEPGLVLLEGNIAELFGVSRSPVRETLSRLHDEGVICRFEGRGYLVGSRPGEVIRRSLTEDDFPPEGKVSRIVRSERWRVFADRVERDVVLCSMKGKFELNELNLARELDVSRTITHQILLYLQSIGVVEKVKYTGWKVVPLNNERLSNLYEARRQLEPFMISHASRNISDKELDYYIGRLDMAASNYPDIQSSFLDELENDLHHEAVSRGGNVEIMNMLRRTHPILLVSKHLLGSSIDLPEEEPFFDEHRWVFDRMRQRNPDDAARALDEHLYRSESKVIERLDIFRREGAIDVPGYIQWMEK